MNKSINFLLVAIGTAVLGKTLLDISLAIKARKESEEALLKAIKNNSFSVIIDEQGKKIAVFSDFCNN